MLHPPPPLSQQYKHYDIRPLLEKLNHPPRQHSSTINYRHARQAETILNVIKLPVCHFIIRHLSEHPDGLIVNELILLARMNLSDNKKQSVISNHLAILRKHGIVSYQRTGKKHIYTLCHSRVSRIASAIESFCHPKTNHDESR